MRVRNKSEETRIRRERPRDPAQAKVRLGKRSGADFMAACRSWQQTEEANGDEDEIELLEKPENEDGRTRVIDPCNHHLRICGDDGYCRCRHDSTFRAF